MKTYSTIKLINRVSLFGIFILAIKIFFFEDYFSEKLNLIALIVLIALLVIFPITKVLEKRTKKRYENK